MTRYAALTLALASLAAAQAPLQNSGKPMRVVYECTEADIQAAGLGCSEDDPCPVYLELSNVDAIGNKIFVTGNLHTPMATLYSILLGSEDNGATWTEPHPRLHSSGLDQMQFIDFQNGWISGANLQGAPRDPFFLITTDGGMTWSEHAVFKENRVAAIEDFRFDSSTQGTATIDSRLDGGRIDSYRSTDGGNTWEREESVFDSFVKVVPRVWRVRTDAATHSYVIEKSESNHWQKIASFLVNIASCKE
jgi:Neuraminidase (sialidase)